MSRDALYLSFYQLWSDVSRVSVEHQILFDRHGNGQPVTGNILRWSRNGKFGVILSLTLSASRFVVMSAASIFKQDYRRSQELPPLPPGKLHTLIVQLYGLSIQRG